MKWECPKCGAEPDKHGRGKCITPGHLHAGFGSSCSGFLCECDANDVFGDLEHGESLAKPCNEARCHHCGWEGTFPVAPKGMQAWEKKALAAGWSPPDTRKKELGL
jgi:hypothetical protein